MPAIAVITGASSGIGRALTLELVSRELIVIAIARNGEELGHLQKQFPDRIKIIPADITTEVGLNQITQGISNLNINYLVHCAGIVSPLGLLHEASSAALRTAIETNLLAPIVLTQALLPMFNKESGRILNITSVAAEEAVSGVGAYCITKSALNMWTRVLQNELPKHILATEVIPGEVDTSMQRDLREAPLEKFPLATEFQEAYRNETLIPAAACADFLADLLLKTGAKEYSGKKWNIYKDYHKEVPLPLNKDKLSDK